ncbi:MAG TPA: PepSY-associated TM helix domain-containing protein, partial [Bryobacteraceae bacterium]|nr:PepSY-associated TM helix domain-containing protein [Bryobacteraceae bacterium]
MRVALWERWLRQPKSLWLRKALFQVHLWTGLSLGLYVLVISITGSAIVFRNELYNALWPGPRMVAISGPPLTHDQLRDAARRAYPRYKVSWIWDTTRRHQASNQAVEIWMDRGGHRKERLFDPYTGQDLGESRPYSIQFLAWLADLHINLLAGKMGRMVNGVGAIFIAIISITGAVIWWPGVRTWRRGLAIQPASNWKLFNWELHSVVGFWMLPVVFVFGLVGTYAGFPKPFQALVNQSAPPRAGEKIIRWFSYLHFGNFGGWPSKAVWVILGLAPAFLFVTGAL